MEELQSQIDAMKIEIESLKAKIEHFGDPHEYMIGVLEEAIKAVRRGSVSNGTGN
jgi:hypothetical protein